MMRKWLIVCFLLVSIFNIEAQELNASVTINAERMTDVNPQIFKNLETKVKEFLNTTKWTDREYTQNEKIECNFFINISEFKNNNVTATLQIQSSRPIFNSTYSAPILNINDKEFSFRFLEYEQLVYDQNSFTSNLISVLAYYVNIIIGVDMDSFGEMAGTKYLQNASNIMNIAQTSGYKGWSQSEGGNSNRYFFISDMLSNTYSPYRKAIFQYHYNGLDTMTEDLKKAKQNVSDAIQVLSKIQNVRPNALLTRTFFDAKTDEIVSIFTGGPVTNNADLIDTLNRISPLNSVKWNKIR